jgi:hypothetical protein
VSDLIHSTTRCERRAGRATRLRIRAPGSPCTDLSSLCSADLGSNPTQPAPLSSKPAPSFPPSSRHHTPTSNTRSATRLSSRPTRSRPTGPTGSGSTTPKDPWPPPSASSPVSSPCSHRRRGSRMSRRSWAANRSEAGAKCPRREGRGWRGCWRSCRMLRSGDVSRYGR